jgi:hypothetical protein
MIAPLVLFAVSITGVTGQWHSTTSISGTVTIQDLAMPIARGVIQGGGISFSALTPADGKLVPVSFTGTLEGAVLRLDMGGTHLAATRIQPTAQTIRIERPPVCFGSGGPLGRRGFLLKPTVTGLGEIHELILRSKIIAVTVRD